MDDTPATDLRRGWTTGACATAATRAALMRLWGGAFPREVTITLPRGETPTFALAHSAEGDGWAEVGITKDAGDDPDVTHGALIVARVTPGGDGVRFAAGPGVGTVTKPGLPIPPGEPAINPVPREMMWGQVEALAAEFGHAPDVEIRVSIPGGEALAAKTWNPRLGITGGLSVLGTTGIVRPFSCAAWIASIHRGIDVARAEGLTHVAGCTGATSERAVQALYGLSDGAMLDMGDFAGGMLKYLAKHPVGRVTIGGGIGKITKLAQGAMDLHSKRAQVDLALLAELAGDARVRDVNTALEAYEIAGKTLAMAVADRALGVVRERFGAEMVFDVVIVDRDGAVIARAGP
ncbi:cobalt-precorrin-5B (C(1))-methyltransferase [Maritimibacter sp. UBA3975]|uniref:cobalt-precorrin-5B (C(1))-methyltransferase n=1 Tax=Maritimibacter sp. UBA3975 TaxID=1946833 RepID=UPI000C09A6F1|nr:cobalt-precorrin-5B (C(1))-methyltransferase [Maritimibacter sp. UBA3975]MAM60330.1 cobalt-precorrin-5B (C(1))-methyltransferase [Maritimibacter sp.]|tara:strand:- start:12840 stop:13886 length:1047 start_codon:yes stop_codon:yes gene_type:complete